MTIKRTITVEVSVGVGGWTASKTVELVSAPHVGDQIMVGDVVVTCETVTIDRDRVYVRERVNFKTEADAAEYFQ